MLFLLNNRGAPPPELPTAVLPSPYSCVSAHIAQHPHRCDSASSGRTSIAPTTALAARNIGRNFIGCEMSEEYYNKSKERLNE